MAGRLAALAFEQIKGALEHGIRPLKRAERLLHGLKGPVEPLTKDGHVRAQTVSHKTYKDTDYKGKIALLIKK